MKNIKRSLSIILILLLMIATISGCVNNSEKKNSGTSDRSVTVTDMSGDSVTIEGEVEKIVNLWPAGTSSFFAMGAGDLIVGLAVNNPGTMNSWTKLFYPNCENIPALGGITPSIENIINLDPDLVIIHPSTAKDGLAQKIRDAGVPAININFNNYETMVQAYTVLGEVLGGDYQKKLESWCDKTNTKLENVRSLTGSIPEAERPIVYYAAGQTDSLTTTMNANSIINDWVGSAGGYYAAQKLELSNASEVTAEAVLKLNPDVIISAGVYQHILKNKLEMQSGWKELDAVKNARVYTNPYGCFNWDRFGLESQLQINYALMCIQPKIAADNGITRESMIKDIVDFYKAYADYELTEAQAENMLNGLTPDGEQEMSSNQ